MPSKAQKLLANYIFEKMHLLYTDNYDQPVSVTRHVYEWIQMHKIARELGLVSVEHQFTANWNYYRDIAMKFWMADLMVSN